MSHWRSYLLATAVTVVLAGKAHAQDAFGFEPGHGSGQLHDPLSAHSPWHLDKNRIQGGTFFGYATDSVYGCEQLDDGSGCSGGVVPWVQDDFMLSADGFLRLPSNRLSVGAGTRLRLASAPSGVLPTQLRSEDAFEGNWEDLRLSGRLDLGIGRRLALAPLLSLRLDRDTQVKPGDESADGTLALGPLYGLGNSLALAAPMGIALQNLPLHLSFDPEVGAQMDRPDVAEAAQALGIEPMEYWMRARANAAWTLNDRTVLLSEGALRLRSTLSGTDAPTVELRGGLRRSLLDERLQVTALVGRSPNLGLGSPGFRGGLALRWTGPPTDSTAPEDDPTATPLLLKVVDVQGEALAPTILVDGQVTAVRRTADGSTSVPVPAGAHSIEVKLDGYATLSETVEAPERGDWQLTRVLPPAGGDGVLLVDLRDPTGTPLPSVRIILQPVQSTPSIDLGEVCGGCDLTYRGLPEGPHLLDFGAPGMAPAQVPITIGSTAPDPLMGTVFLAPPVGQLNLQVLDSSGRPVPDAAVNLLQQGGDESVAVPLDASGGAKPVLAPGRWIVDTQAPGRGRQRHELFIDPWLPVSHALTVELQAVEAEDTLLRLEVVDADNRPVEGARVVSGDRVFTTSSGGKIYVEGLSVGDLTFEIEHEDFRVESPRTVPIVSGEATELTIALAWKPGAVVLRTVDPSGRPVDSVVQLTSAERTLLERTGPDGLLSRTLASGQWSAEIADQRHQPVRVDLAVDSDRNRVFTVDLVARPKTEVEGASYSVRVLDEAEEPVEGAEVRLNDVPVGTTSNLGTLRLSAVSSAEERLAVQGRYFDPWSEPIGDQSEVEARLRSRLGRVQLLAVTPDGGPIPAQVRITGLNGETRLSRLGTDGQRSYRLAPGPWEFAFASEQNGFGLEDLLVEREAEEAYRVEWVGEPSEEAAVLPAVPQRSVEVTLWSRPEDAPTAGMLRLLGPDVMPPLQIGEDGRWDGRLRVGQWEVLATAPELGIGGADLPLEAAEDPYQARIELGEVSVELTSDEVSIDDTLYFSLGSAELEEGATESLAAVARTIRSNPQLRRIEVQGHADRTGSAELNQSLSEARAIAVMEALLAYDVEPHRLEAVGYGESRQVSGGDAENRRVVFRVVELREAVEQTPTDDSAP